MNSLNDSHTDGHKILVVDDEVANLQKLRRTFINRYPVLTASSGKEALELMQKEPDIAVIIADQRMPDMTGVEFLRQTLLSFPHAVRIILTGFTDVDVLMDAINSCKVYRYIVKPWDPPDLLMTVERGLETYRLSVENEQFRRELIRRERFARELEIARDIQRYILPPCCPALAGYEMAVQYHPAREIGGDLYDFDWNAPTRMLQIVIGDVSGKSIPSALYGAVFSGQMRTLFAGAMSPGETLAFLNDSLVPRYQVNNYVAVTYLRLNIAEGRGSMANGGMPYPYIVRGDQVLRVALGGVPLGLLEGTTYEEIEVQMLEGDLLVFASDGATDAMNPEGQMYEESRFIQSLRKHASEPIADLVLKLYGDIFAFTQNVEPHDDITILALRRRTS